MKKTLPIVIGIALSVITFAAGCSTIGGKQESSGQEISASGPTIMNARSNPETFELNNRLQPMQTAEVYADVKDFTSQIRNVRLRFLHVPIEVPMQRVAGTTWRAELTPQQLKALAVSGQTMNYEANVIATNEKGQTAVAKEPLKVAVKAPDVTQLVG